MLRRPGLLGAILVVLTLGLAAALAYQAVRAAASHRAAVETALDHHATIAAWRFTREARGWTAYVMNAAVERLEQDVERRASLPGPEVLQRLFAEKYCECVTAAFARTFVRVTRERGAALDVIGEPLAERARDALRDEMRRFAADTTLLAGARRWRILSPGAPRLNRGNDIALLWRVEDMRRKRGVVYGMIVEPAQIARPLIGAFEQSQFFPPTLVSAAEAAALVRLHVAGPNGVTVFARGPETDRFVGTDTLGAEFGGLVATAAVNPAAAPVLVTGGVPQSRVPMIVALLVLALTMGAAATLLMRREHRLGRLREDFVSGVSHELRTPLTQIRMLSELLETDSFKSVAERDRAIRVIHRESLRLTNLVDNVLEFTRLRRSANVNGSERVSLGEVLREVADSLAPLVEAQGNRLELVADADVEVRGDRDTVGRIVRNLIENAIKYGASTQTIRMTLARAGSGAKIMVDDEGPGIPAEERSRIWQPFYRLDRDRNAPAGGSGLGLSVVADLARHLGGSVSVGDAPDRGARFIVELPGIT
jgi:signal transduction histidine kinase